MKPIEAVFFPKNWLFLERMKTPDASHVLVCTPGSSLRRIRWKSLPQVYPTKRPDAQQSVFSWPSKNELWLLGPLPVVSVAKAFLLCGEEKWPLQKVPPIFTTVTQRALYRSSLAGAYHNASYLVLLATGRHSGLEEVTEELCSMPTWREIENKERHF